MNRSHWPKSALLAGLLALPFALNAATPMATPTAAPPLATTRVHKQTTPKLLPITKSQAPAHAKKMNKQIWNLKEADIRAVIQTMSILTGKNFIVDPRVQGKITLVSHTPMTPNEIYQVFLSMLQVLNYAAIPSGPNIVKIVPAMNAKAYGGTLASQSHPGVGDEIVVRVVPINHVSAAQLVPVLRPLMQQWGSVTAYTPSNSLILAGTATNMQRLVSIVQRMDNKSASGISMVMLKHADAKKLVGVINTLQSEGRTEGKTANISLAADTQNNSILISGNMQNRLSMMSLIRRLDKTSSTVTNTKVVHLNYLEAKKLAPVLAKIADGLTSETTGKKTNVSHNNSSVSVQADAQDNALIIHASRSITQNLVQVIHQLDVRPSEVLVEAIIVRINESLLDQLGVVWGTPDTNGNNTNGSDSSGQSTGNPSNTFGIKLNHGIGFLPNGNIQALLHLLASSGSTDILATPSIVVLNNQKASISDGKNIGILNRQYATNTTTTNNAQVVPFNTIQRKDVTLSLKVTPQISPNHSLRLKIEQQDNSLDATSSVNTDPENPTIDVSKITTSVLVHSGDILVLGGLIKHDQLGNVQKVPILGDIPVLGNLFKYHTKNVEKQDLMVFLRPVILNSRFKIRQQTVKRYRYMRYQQIQAQSGGKLSKEDLPTLPPISRPHLLRLPSPMETISHAKRGQ